MRGVLRFLLLAVPLCLAVSGQETAQILVVPDALHTSNDRAALESFAADCEAQESYDLAAIVLTRAWTISPDDLDLRLRLAENQYKVGQAGKADAFAHADAVAQNPSAGADTLIRARMLRGLLYLEQDLPALASADFAGILEQDDTHARAAIGMAATETAEAKLVEASERLNKLGNAIQAYDVETRYLLRWAMQRFEQDRQVFPDDAAHHAAYGKLLYRAGRLPDALMALRRAATLQGSDTELWNLVAAIAAQLGSAAEVRAAGEASLAINPEQPEIRTLLESFKE